MIGFIGAGNMASAIIKGMASKGISPETIYVYDHNRNKVEELLDLGIRPCSTIYELIKSSKYLFLAVKPNVYDDLLSEIKDCITDENVLITMAAGYEISRVKSIVGDRKTVRTMPNTPALIGKGFTALAFDNRINRNEKEEVESMISSFGYVQEMKESLIDAYSAISGSGPAFIFMFIEAVADAAVLLGVPRPDAYKAAEATMLGSSALALETAMHPAELKDMVCSPGGTTIEGVRTLEENGFRSSIIEAILNTYKKNLDITNIR